MPQYSKLHFVLQTATRTSTAFKKYVIKSLSNPGLVILHYVGDDTAARDFPHGKPTVFVMLFAGCLSIEVANILCYIVHFCSYGFMQICRSFCVVPEKRSAGFLAPADFIVVFYNTPVLPQHLHSSVLFLTLNVGREHNDFRSVIHMLHVR